MRTAFIALAASTFLTACETPTPTTQRYNVTADNNQAIKAIGATGIGVRRFVGPAEFNRNCRAVGPLYVADNLTHTQYIQKAFEDELKMAGAYAQGAVRVTIDGRVNKMEFSSTRAVTGGYWQIDLSLYSSNGARLDVNEYYEFNSGYIANEACRNTAEAYFRAVQNLIGKAVKSPTFAELLR